jgi:hypothetical protein
MPDVMPTTHADTINAGLLAFLKHNAEAAAASWSKAVSSAVEGSGPPENEKGRQPRRPSLAQAPLNQISSDQILVDHDLHDVAAR